MYKNLIYRIEQTVCLRVCLKTFDKRGREVDNKGKTGGR